MSDGNITAQVDLFLDLYKQLEDELENRYRNARRRYASVIIEFSRDGESEIVRDKLEVCREVRNLLTHTANLKGEPVACPSGAVIEAMQEILDYVRKPPLALKYATKADQVMKAQIHQKVFRVMEVMEKNGFSHVPVMANGNMEGIFSIRTVFKHVLNGGKVNKESTLKDMERYLPFREHDENYAFVGKEASYLSVRKIFDKLPGKNQRVSAVFITETGREDGAMLGMLTPWDMMKEPY